MSTTSSAGAFNPTLDELRTIQAGKYLLACALTTTLYDIFICLDQEWKLIWTKTSTPKATKAAFGLLRYGVAIGLCYVVYVVLGLRKSSQNEDICKTFFEFAFIVVTLTSIIANSYIVYHHYILWEKRRIILIIMSTISIICYIPTLAMAIMSAVAYRDISRYDPTFNACIYPKRPKSVNAYFTILTTFDLLTIGVAVLNSVDRPYRQYGEVISNILRDGSLYFLALVTIRLINTVLSFILPPQESFLISFNVWGMISIILSRFMLRVEGLRAHNEPKGSIRIWNDHSEAFELNRWDTSSGRR